MSNLKPPILAFVDLETTHLDPNKGEIVEIGIIRIHDNKILDIVEHKVKPEHLETAHPRALEVNGYNEQDWSSAISQLDCAHLVEKLLKDTVIIGHNISFDLKFLRALMIQHDIRFDLWRAPNICTRDLAKNVFKTNPNVNRFRLDDLRVHFGWSLENAHTALKDTVDCCKLFYKCISTPCPLDNIERTNRHIWNDGITYT